MMIHEQYLNLAFLKIQPNCIRRNYGVVIVKDGELISSGNTSIPGYTSCTSGLGCERERLGIPSGQGYEKCNSVHAEVNACLNAGKDKCEGATVYLAGKDAKTGKEIDAMPCRMCIRVMKECGIANVITRGQVIACR